jgi:hypothetical protein
VPSRSERETAAEIFGFCLAFLPSVDSVNDRPFPRRWIYLPWVCGG